MTSYNVLIVELVVLVQQCVHLLLLGVVVALAAVGRVQGLHHALGNHLGIVLGRRLLLRLGLLTRPFAQLFEAL